VHQPASIVTRLAAATAFAIFLPSLLGAQAGTNSSGGYILDYLTGTVLCSTTQSSSSGPTLYNCPTTASAGGTASGGGAADNFSRYVAAGAVLTQSGPPGSMFEQVDGSGTVNSRLFIDGTPSADDQLVFHFLGTQSATFTGGSPSDFVTLQLDLSSNGTQFALARDQRFADGTGGLTLYNARQTASGFDLFAPLTGGSFLDYTFRAVVELIDYPDTDAGSKLTGSISLRLGGIDAVNSQGDPYASAVFSAVLDDQPGFATISLTTTPEPTSMALVATGLVGVVGVTRRKRKARRGFQTPSQH